MKNFKIFLMVIALAATVATNYGCGDDEDVTTCSDGIQNGDETGVDCGGSSCAACPTCSDGVQNGDETGVDCGGSCTACPTCDDGIQNGDEEGVDCGGTNCPVCLVGLQGTKWQSSGDNVATLLAGPPFNVDSIYVEFEELTYHVEQFSGGVKIDLDGSYSQTESGTGNIWDITLMQSSPSALTAVGIYEISADGNILTYEVVQTEPDIGATPPTATDGFGSTNGGALSDWNVQTYEKVE
ncbi:MAG TPA: hypothetical protein ENJ95_20095 [Bacteroidetes bacterium]|nr:hypothetical protein [Bacteroidota bacterium]